MTLYAIIAATIFLMWLLYIAGRSLKRARDYADENQRNYERYTNKKP